MAKKKELVVQKSDFEIRKEKAEAEMQAIFKKYEIDIKIELVYAKAAIVPRMVVYDLKKYDEESKPQE